MIVALALFTNCNQDLPQHVAAYWAEEPGEPAGLMDPSLREQYDRGRRVMERAFRSDDGLGPTFNTDSCAGCHQFPVAGGSGPRYRDFFLVWSERFDGTREEGGSNGVSPVRNLYALGPSFHVAEPADTVIYGRRNTPSGLGVGLFAFVPDTEILKREDPVDDDGDGISGRANFEQGRVGRFGYKSQAATLESFNRGAMLNQMGITSDPLFYDIPGSPDPFAYTRRPAPMDWLLPRAYAQVAATDAPTTDDDGVPDPEMSNDDQEALLVFSTFLGAPRPGPMSAEAEHGELLFDTLGCEACHVPALQSTMGLLPAYTDLLLHDMGDDLADGVVAGLATEREFRTQPLWGVQLHGPYLHDGRADTLHDAILWHGGEAQASRERYQAVPAHGQQAVIAFLRSLGGWEPNGQVKVGPGDDLPGVGVPGGPDQALSPEDLEVWAAGRALFDRSILMAEGLGADFNADSCRACHQDPVLGGAGGIDTSVLRFGHRDADGTWSPLARGVLPRSSLPGNPPVRLPDEANVVEPRQPPTTLGVGVLGRIDAAAILAHADPDDLDGDGISGRARILADGSVGRFGWKAQIPSVADFAADALLNEVGLTVDPALSRFTSADDGDDFADPELATTPYDALVFYLEHLGPPPRKAVADADAVDLGEGLFAEVGCAACHLPELGGVAAYTDLLLHDVWPDPMAVVEQEEGVLGTEFRTPPLWGIADTAPYLHDGSAPTLEGAVAGHAGEAQASREAFEALSAEDRAALIAFLESL